MTIWLLGRTDTPQLVTQRAVWLHARSKSQPDAAVLPNCLPKGSTAVCGWAQISVKRRKQHHTWQGAHLRRLLESTHRVTRPPYHHDDLTLSLPNLHLILAPSHPSSWSLVSSPSCPETTHLRRGSHANAAYDAEARHEDAAFPDLKTKMKLV